MHCAGLEAPSCMKNDCCSAGMKINQARSEQEINNLTLTDFFVFHRAVTRKYKLFPLLKINWTILSHQIQARSLYHSKWYNYDKVITIHSLHDSVNESAKKISLWQQFYPCTCRQGEDYKMASACISPAPTDPLYTGKNPYGKNWFLYFGGTILRSLKGLQRSGKEGC